MRKMCKPETLRSKYRKKRKEKRRDIGRRENGRE